MKKITLDPRFLSLNPIEPITSIRLKPPICDTLPEKGEKGEIIFDNNEIILKFWDGTNWIPLGKGEGAGIPLQSITLFNLRWGVYDTFMYFNSPYVNTGGEWGHNVFGYAFKVVERLYPAYTQYFSIIGGRYHPDAVEFHLGWWLNIDCEKIPNDDRGIRIFFGGSRYHKGLIVLFGRRIRSGAYEGITDIFLGDEYLYYGTAGKIYIKTICIETPSLTKAIIGASSYNPDLMISLNTRMFGLYDRTRGVDYLNIYPMMGATGVNELYFKGNYYKLCFINFNGIDLKVNKFLIIPRWTNNTRPINPEAGTIGFNEETKQFEGFNGEDWIILG